MSLQSIALLLFGAGGGPPPPSPPTATGMSTAEAFTLNTAKTLAPIVISDADSPTVTARLTMSTAAAGTLSVSGGATFIAGVWLLTGSESK